MQPTSQTVALAMQGRLETLPLCESSKEDVIDSVQRFLSPRSVAKVQAFAILQHELASVPGSASQARLLPRCGPFCAPYKVSSFGPSKKLPSQAVNIGFDAIAALPLSLGF